MFDAIFDKFDFNQSRKQTHHGQLRLFLLASDTSEPSEPSRVGGHDLELPPYLEAVLSIRFRIWLFESILQLPHPQIN